VGAIPEVLRSGETALLVAPGDRAALTQAASLLLADPDTAKRIGTAGRELYESQFTLARFATNLSQIYRSCLDGALARLRAE
jgi:starch synthase